ncbi:hypothetical protein [Nocardia sp. NPDC024068]|uniref:hypothetical protein n=1 Tax=Nocardia sp. NPDC024068 TaxID=3157197 RepID=UPI003411946D
MTVRDRVLFGAALVVAVAVAIPAIATLSWAAIGHPECATIPEDVGPCGYWSRVEYFGPFIMLWGAAIVGSFGATAWLVVVALFGLFAALSSGRKDRFSDDRPSSHTNSQHGTTERDHP